MRVRDLTCGQAYTERIEQVFQNWLRPNNRAAECFMKEAVTIIVVSEGHAYMARRLKIADNFGKLGFPGGKCEADDADARESAARELAEEMGITVRPGDLQFIGVSEFKTPDFGRYRTTAYVLRLSDGISPQNAEPHKHGPWLRIPIPAIEQMREDDLLPGTKEFLRSAMI